MNSSIRDRIGQLGRRARWVLAALALVVVVLPSFWLAALEQTTSTLLLDEREHGLKSDAELFSQRYTSFCEDVLYNQNVRFFVLREGMLVEEEGERYYETGLAFSEPHPVEYAFLVDLSDTTFYIDRRAAARDELPQVFGMMELRPQPKQGMLFGRGFLDGPYGPFHYAYVLDSLVAREALVMRGVKLDVGVVRDAMLPRAFEQLRSRLREQRGAEALADGSFGFAVEMPDTTLVFASLTAGGLSDEAPALGSFVRPLDLNGLFPNWNVRVDYLNELRASRWKGMLSSLVPLVLVILGVVVTARLAMREVELNRVKSVFVSNVSHEMKTPLTKISFFNELIEGLPREADDKRRRYHGVIRQECERLTILIDNVLDLNRIERGEMKYEFVQVPIAEVVTEVVETFNAVHAAEGFQIDVEMEDDLPRMLIDPGAVKQALINLTDNAVKYSPEPHTLGVRAGRTRLHGDDAVALTVEDRGVGIARDKLTLIFEEFYRVEGEGRKVSGSGLGLALVRHIVAAHGGRIDVDSKVGVGSTFTISLPLAPPKKTEREYPVS